MKVEAAYSGMEATEAGACVLQNDGRQPVVWQVGKSQISNIVWAYFERHAISTLVRDLFSQLPETVHQCAAQGYPHNGSVTSAATIVLQRGDLKTACDPDFPEREIARYPGQ